MRLAKWTSAVASLSLMIGAGPALADGEPGANQNGAVQEVDGSTPNRQPMKGIEEITVTGSLVPRTETDGPSSVDVIDRFEIESLGVQSPIDLVERLTYNSGSQSRSDAFRFGGGYGSAQVNLRGLGLGTTLVLVDGRRQTISGTIATDGSTFVDVNNIPIGMIERVEVLKEGAAATYGSDAVAGVINFITRKDVEGFELRTDYQRSRGDQTEQGITGLWGWTSQDSTTHFQVHGNFFDSSQLNSTERSFTQNKRFPDGRLINQTSPDQNRPAGLRTGQSALGGPGGYFVPAMFGPVSQTPGDVLAANGGDPSVKLVPGGTLTLGDALTAIGTTQSIGTVPAVDPGCEGAGGSRAAILSGAVGRANALASPADFCLIEFADNFNLFEHEQRAKYNVLFRHDFSETLSATFKADFSYNDVDDVGNSPSFPPLSTFSIGPDNPGNEFGAFLVQNTSGRPLGDAAPTKRAYYYTRNMRFESLVNGEFDNGWDWNVGLSYQQERRGFQAPDNYKIEYQNALLGFGGSACPLLQGGTARPTALNPLNAQAALDAYNAANGTNIVRGAPGSPCQYFNPFGNAVTNPGGVGVGGITLGNTQDVISSFAGFVQGNNQTALLLGDGVITGELFELPAGPVGFALGYQYRRASFRTNRNDDTTLDENGINQVTLSGDSRLLFLDGGTQPSVDQSVYAFFTEAVVPATEALEFQLAVRYENYNGSIGSSVDPKIGFRWDAADFLTLRGSFSTTFRAPSLNQQFSRNTAVQSVRSSGGPGAALGSDSGFKAIDNAGNPNLNPEEADVYNFGAIVKPFDGFDLTLDYFRIDFKDAVQSQVPQSIINAEEAAAGNAGLIAMARAGTLLDGDGNPTDRFCLDSRYTPMGVTRNTAAGTCNVSRVEAMFINNSSIVLDGIDVGLSWEMDVAGLDSFRFFSDLTHLIQFDVTTANGQVRKAAGSLNETLFVSSLPKWRLNTGIQAALGNHRGGVTFRYISGYDDDRPFNPGFRKREISDHNEVDLYYAYDLERYNATLQLGVFNVLNNEPPFVDLDFNFDTRVVDPRGRRFYSNLVVRF